MSPTAATAEPARKDWAGAWPDALAFAGGLALAWFARWETTDLVWSLWLSSLVVGYATIVWSIFGPAVFIGTKAWQDRQLLGNMPAMPAALGGAALVVGGVFLLAFFTVHFGMFHFVHSVFLQSFFPVTGQKTPGIGPQAVTYFEVLRRYWIFLPMAFLAERQAFRFSPAPPAPPDTSVKAADIAARKARNAQIGGMTGMMAPYKNVVRMHLLIFFFAAAHFAGLENFFVYAVVYAVYFFPWRLLKREKAAGALAA
ncbi:MAG: DUF6498-containing protein [Opitutaceae bacterium]